MSGLFLRGALVEYGSDVLGPLPNIVVFQFNPDSISRTIKIADSVRSANPEDRVCHRERGQTSAPPIESFQITAHFSAADDLGKGGAASAVSRAFGIGPQLAALEKMVYPTAGLIGELLGAEVDAVGSALEAAVGGDDKRPIPRLATPRLLFVWGLSRVVPVEIKSMTINEQKYDALLNPVQAEVKIGLDISNSVPEDDWMGEGAMKYTAAIKNTQAQLNLAKATELAIDIIPF